MLRHCRAARCHSRHSPRARSRVATSPEQMRDQFRLARTGRELRQATQRLTEERETAAWQATMDRLDREDAEARAANMPRRPHRASPPHSPASRASSPMLSPSRSTGSCRPCLTGRRSSARTRSGSTRALRRRHGAGLLPCAAPPAPMGPSSGSSGARSKKPSPNRRPRRRARSACRKVRRLRAEQSATAPEVRPSVDPDEAAAFIEGIAATWELATPEERARLVQATYERVTVQGPNVVRVKLTPMAERTGLPALLPEDVPMEWAVARPTVARPTGVGRAIATNEIPIEGRDEWRAAVARLLAWGTGTRAAPSPARDPAPDGPVGIPSEPPSSPDLDPQPRSRSTRSASIRGLSSAKPDLHSPGAGRPLYRQLDAPPPRHLP